MLIDSIASSSFFTELFVDPRPLLARQVVGGCWVSLDVIPKPPVPCWGGFQFHRILVMIFIFDSLSN